MILTDIAEKLHYRCPIDPSTEAKAPAPSAASAFFGAVEHMITSESFAGQNVVDTMGEIIGESRKD